MSSFSAKNWFAHLRYKFSVLLTHVSGLQRTMVIMVALSITAPAVVLFSFQQQLSEEVLRNLLMQAKEDVVAMGVASIAEPMWALDNKALDVIGGKLLNNPQVLAVRIHEYLSGASALQLSKPGVNLASMEDASGLNKLNIEHHVEEIVRDGESIGTLHVWFDSSYGEMLLTERRWQTLAVVIAQVLLSLLVLIGLLNYRVFKPINLLKEQATSLLSGVKPSAVTVWQRNDELGQLGRHLAIVHGRLADLFGELEKKNKQLEQVAMYDALTGLCNRTLFHELVERELRQAQRINQKFGLMFIDLDHFKSVNDTLGHDAGDAVLIETSRRLLQAFRDVDVVCRQSGDEFLVMARAITSWDQLGELADRLIHAIEAPIMIGTTAVNLSASVGIVLYPENGSQFETLVKAADTAMYHAKTLGRGRYNFFDSDLNARCEENRQLDHELGLAIREHALRLHYQPQIDALSGRLVSVEALVRWEHPVRGLLYPDSFISLAEESGKIADLGAWTLRTACQQLVHWKAQGLDVPKVAVNVSAIEFNNRRLLESLQAALIVSGLDARHLDVEITETVLMEYSATSQSIVDHLRELGVGIAIDDFGIGYSSLSYIKYLHPTQIKIDRSFVSDLENSEDSRSIIKGIVGMSAALGLIVVAEGVENDEQQQFLKAAGCSVLQGYLIAKPMSAENFEIWLKNWQQS